MRTLLLVSMVAAVTAFGCSSAEPSSIPGGKTTPGSTAQAPEPTPTGGVNDLPPSKPSEPPPAPGNEISTETWKDGKQLATSVTIKAGATVDIESGATVTAASGVAITVKGTLRVVTGAKHASLVGKGWLGIVVAQGGTLNVDGLDITDAASGVWTMTGNAEAKLLNSNITNSGTPFKMEAGSKLTVTRSNVVKAAGQSTIAGTFVASYLDYDKVSNEGLVLNDPAGTMTISDSTLRGIGGGDYVVSSAGALVKVEYSTITGSHCGLHFSAVDKFIIDHVSDDQNSYGAMLYGSGAGPNEILSSNVRSTDKDLAMQGTNGPTTIDKSFTGGKNTLAANAKITNAAKSPVLDAKPR
jgi:hypothetical protein